MRPRKQFMQPRPPIHNTSSERAAKMLDDWLLSQPGLAGEPAARRNPWGQHQIKADAPITQEEATLSPWGSSQRSPDNDFPSEEEEDWAIPQEPLVRRASAYATPVATRSDAALSWMIPPTTEHPALERKSQSAQKRVRKQPKRTKARRKRRLPIWMAAISLIAVIAIIFTLGNGVAGAWTADEFRAIAGPVAAAQVEAFYLNAQNTTYSWEYRLGLHHVASPFQAKSTSIKLATPAKAKVILKPMSLVAMIPQISPALSGEGVWNTLEAAPGTYSYLPLDAKAFIRPDPTTPYAIVSLLQFDARFMRMHIVSGTQEPGGPLAAYGSGVIPQADQQENTLLATMNGGFKYADGAFGLMTNGKVYVPPQQNAATLAITKNGTLMIGAWGTDPLLSSTNTNLVAWRQNAGLLINNGEISTLAKDGAAWGGTILNSEYTWRSGIGITAQGNLVYAAGNALIPETLGKALKAAGAVMAMETDINPFWTRAFLYQQAKNGTLTINKLSTDMQGTGKEYLTPNQRDFFYLTRYKPTKLTS